MNYIKAGRYPITEQQIRTENPNVSFPADMQPVHVEFMGYEPVAPVTPTYDPSTDTAVELAPVKVAGAYKQVWQVSPLPVAALKARKKADVEAERDRLTTEPASALGRQWDADTRSQTLLNGAITLALAGGPLPLFWRDADNVNMAITDIAQLVAIGGAIAANVQQTYIDSWDLKADIIAANTPGAVKLIEKSKRQ